MMRAVVLIAGVALVIGLAYSWLNSAQAAQPAEGEDAPAFRLQDQDGQWQALSDFRGQWVAVYFYPKADTPGCTTEACEFRDNIFAFEEIGATVIGISIATLLGGVVVTESVFNIPGLGRLTVDAVLARDYPTVQAVILLFSLAYVIINLVIDVLYTALDPRIRY